MKPDKFYPTVIMVLALLMLGCKPKSNQYSAVGVSHAPKSITVHSVSIDSIILPKFNTSYAGFARVMGDSIYFFDQRFCWVYVFDADGQLRSRHLGQGRGPEEIDTGMILDMCQLPNGSFFIYGPGWDYFVYDGNWRVAKPKQTFAWQVKRDGELRLDNPDNYTIHYGTFYPICCIGQYVLLPITPVHNNVNGDDRTRRYLHWDKISRVMLFDYSKNSTDGVGIKYPPVYGGRFNKCYQVYFNNVATSSTEVYSNFYADSLIYVYDKELQPLRAFGYAGRGMDENYKQLLTNSEIEQYFESEYKTMAHYSSLAYCEKVGTAVRTYNKGAHASTDGLQIYRNEVLIADVDVPKGFKVEGYIAPYYLSSAIIDEVKEEIKIYRFKLE